MLVIFRVSAAVALGLTICKSLLPRSWADILPFGGSELSELGLVFGVSFIICECVDGLRHAGSWWHAKNFPLTGWRYATHPPCQNKVIPNE